jgi:hypothetical protein
MSVPGACHFYHSCRILHPKDNYKEELIPPYSVQSADEFKVMYILYIFFQGFVGKLLKTKSTR